MTDFSRYASENEDLEDEDLGSNCESCDKYLGEEGLVICKRCETIEAEMSGERVMEAAAGIR